MVRCGYLSGLSCLLSGLEIEEGDFRALSGQKLPLPALVLHELEQAVPTWTVLAGSVVNGCQMALILGWLPAANRKVTGEECVLLDVVDELELL